MKKFLVLMLTLSVGLGFGASAKRVKMSANSSTSTYDIGKGIHTVRASRGIDVNVTVSQTPSTKARLTVPENITPYVSIRNIRGVLSVTIKDDIQVENH